MSDDDDEASDYAEAEYSEQREPLVDRSTAGAATSRDRFSTCNGDCSCGSSRCGAGRSDKVTPRSVSVSFEAVSAKVHGSSSTVKLEDTAGAKKVTSRPSLKGDKYDKKVWKRVSTSAGRVCLTDLNGATYDVPASRANKALLLLDPMVIAADLAAGQRRCKCSRHCHTKFSIKDFADRRLAYLQSSSEVQATNWLSRQLEFGDGFARGKTTISSERRRKVRYRHGKHDVCPAFYAHLLRVTVNKLFAARAVFLGGGEIQGHAKLGISSTLALSTSWPLTFLNILLRRPLPCIRNKTKDKINDRPRVVFFF